MDDSSTGQARTESASSEISKGLGELCHTDFSPYLGKTFFIAGANNTAYEMELIEVDHKPHDGEQRAPFSLIFKASRDNGILLQAMYDLQGHPQFGTIHDMFLSQIVAPYDHKDRLTHYFIQAVFA